MKRHFSHLGFQVHSCAMGPLMKPRDDYYGSLVSPSTPISHLTNDPKRRDDYYGSLVSPSTRISQSNIHIAKKPKFSLSPAQCTPDKSRSQPPYSITSRIAKYPDRKPGFTRVVHAPVKNSKFGPLSSGKKSENAKSCKESSVTGRFDSYSRRYEQTKMAANRSLRYVTVWREKEKEVIEVDSEDEDRHDLIGDAIIELNIVDSMSSKKTSQKDIENCPELNVRAVEKDVRSLASAVITDASNATTKVVGGDKIDSILMDQGSDDSGLPSYKSLLNGIREHDGILESLNFQIELYAKKMQLIYLQPRKKEEQTKKYVAEKCMEECFVPLTDKEEHEVSYVLSKSNSSSFRRKLLVTHVNSNIDVTVEKLQCLRPKAWLNDEVINLYFELLKEREKREPEKFLKCHFFNTFFYKKLISGSSGYNFQSVRRWTTQRKLGYNISECDKIFVPIHKEVHWCLAIINKKDEKFQYLDSLRGDDSQVLNVLAKYFVDEVKDKCGKYINVSSWEREIVTDLPLQENGFDCGVFMTKYVDFNSRSIDIGLCFTQEHMPYFRLRTAKEILKLRAD